MQRFGKLLKIGHICIVLDAFIYVLKILKKFCTWNMLFIFRDLMGSDELMHYNHMRIFLDEDFTCPETFTVVFLCNFLKGFFMLVMPWSVLHVFWNSLFVKFCFTRVRCIELRTRMQHFLQKMEFCLFKNNFVYSLNQCKNV